MSMATGEIPHSEIPDLHWKAEVTTWPWRKLPDHRWLLIGTCPRCEHLMSHEEVYVPYEAKFTSPDSTIWGVADPPETVSVACNCSVAHPPHREGEGCGQNAEIPFASQILPRW